MSTIDQILFKLVNDPKLELVSTKDATAIRGLVATIKNHYSLTEGQSRFCISVLKNNITILSLIEPDLLDALENPTWSKPFRNIEVIKKLSIDTAPNANNIEIKVIKIESNYSNSFREMVARLSKCIDINIKIPGKIYYSLLTEKNVIALVNQLQPLGFNIDDDIMKYYDTINNWKLADIIDQFTISNITDNEARQILINDIGEDTPMDSIIIEDRKLRYQYQPDNSFHYESADSLTTMIATRKKAKLWVDSNLYSLTEIISSLIELKRTPVLLIFDTYKPDIVTQQLKLIYDALENNNITSDIGLYFRLKNTVGKEFNTFIADKKYNAMLDNNTIVAGVESTNIPKFFLKTTWEPMSVISIGNSLRNSKTAIYANRCDLIITYSNTKPMIVSRNWLQ